jgi:hypothetical protein
MQQYKLGNVLIEVCWLHRSCVLPHQSNIIFESQNLLPDILPTHHLAVSDVMLYDTCQMKKQVYGIWVLRTILDEGRREGEIWEFWG